MKIKLTILALLILAAYTCSAQKTLIVSGEITDMHALPITESYVKVFKAGQKAPIKYFATGAGNTFSFSLQITTSDSLYLSVSNPKKQEYTELIKIEEGNTRLHYRIELLPSVVNLDSLLIHSNPIWKDGDTTFYRAETFGSGNEKKLSELITKIPGFTVAPDGRLQYQNKSVTKILISGEDLFSDKQSLLLENFPAQAIENIQAIENQSAQPLLKGLQMSNQIFVNLQLKKKYVKAAFGTTEMGMSTNGSYNFNPVLFSLYGKIKTAYIGNNNSQGYGSGNVAENELRNTQIRNIENWMPGLYSFKHIPELDTRHYISNELWDNRLKIILPFSKKFVGETEFIYLKDHRTQQYISESNLINDTVLTQRKASETTDYKPEKVWIKQSLKWNMNKKNLLTGNLLLYSDKTSQHIQLKQIQNNYYDTTINSNKNNYQSLIATAAYTGRFNKGLALQVDLEYGHHSYKQQAQTFSNSIPHLFQINDSLNLIDLDRDVLGEYFSAKAVLFKKHRKRIVSPTLLYTYEKSMVEDAFYFRNHLYKTQDSLSPQFSQPGVFKSYRMEAAYNFHFTLGSNNFVQTTQVGVLKTEEENLSQYNIRTDAIGRLAILWKKRKGRTNHEANLSWDRSPLSLPEINSRLFPRKTTIFFIHKIKENAVTNSLHGMYTSRKMLKNQRSLSTFLSIQVQANSGLYRNSYDRFLQISIDSVTNRVTHSVFASLYYNFKIKPIEASVFLNAGYNKNEQLILLHHHIHKTRSHIFSLNMDVSKYYKRKHIFELSSKFQYFLVRYPASLEEARPIDDYAQAWLGLNYEYRVNKVWSLFLDSKLLAEDIFSNQPQNLFFVNSSAQFSPQKSKFRFTLSLENITNLKSFQNIQAARLYFSRTDIPLISRNLLFRVYYGL